VLYYALIEDHSLTLSTTLGVAIWASRFFDFDEMTHPALEISGGLPIF